MIHSEILLPPNAPEIFKDRETLWNEVEKIEKHPKAQLAYSFDIALQNEFTREENMELVQQFLQDEFVSRGMIVDYAIHEKDAGENGIQNPHFHVMCPIRPLNPDGSWGAKQRREYILDEHGNRIPNSKGDYEFNAVPTTDWGNPERLEAWRKAWADCCNAKFEEKQLAVKVDNRSYKRQGIEQIPTIHEGPAVRQMEARGIKTDKGNLNRLIRATNQKLREITRRIKELWEIIQEAKAQLEKEEQTARQSPNLIEILIQRWEQRNAGAWSLKAKAKNFHDYSTLLEFLKERKLYRLADLEKYMDGMKEKSSSMNAELKAKSSHMKELQNLIRYADDFKRLRPVYDELNAIKFRKKRDAFYAEHESELRLFYLAKRKLDAVSPDHKFPVPAWKKELKKLEVSYKKQSEELEPIRQELKELYRIKGKIDYLLRQQNKEAEQENKTNQKKEEYL